LVAGGYYFGWELGIIAGSSYFLGGWLFVA
jgi:hypothetical protein